MSGKRPLSQATLAAKLQAIYGIEIDRSAIARIENGQRYLLDYELFCIAAVLGAEVADLLPPKPPPQFMTRATS